MSSSLGIDPSVEHGAEVIDLRVPADPAYLAVIRTATAGVAARLGLTLDEIEDLRIAVDEACALLLDEQDGAGDDVCLHALFTVSTTKLDVRITGPRSDTPLDTGYAWMLLRALVGEVSTGQDASGRWIWLTHHASTSGEPAGQEARG